MYWDEWKNYYQKIVLKLQLDKKEDNNSSDLLLKWLKSKLSPSTKQTILNYIEQSFLKPIIIAGAGPSLKTDFIRIKRFNFLNKISFIACDGACLLFKEFGSVPNIIFSDLDGDQSALIWALKKGAILIIHGHGDNKAQISDYLNKNAKTISRSMVWGSTQSQPGDGLFNFGGFTDGDRAIITALHFNVPIIGLIGFDFGEIIGEYSMKNSQMQKNTTKKIIKFEIAKELIKAACVNHNGERFNLTEQGEDIAGFSMMNMSRFSSVCDEWYTRHYK